jgi:beta-glucosidase
MGGPWGAAQEPANHVTVLDGLRNVLGDAEIFSARGVDIDGEATTGIAPAVELCERAQTIVLCVGEAANMSGEAASRAHLGLPGQQRALAEAVMARAKSLAKPVVVVLFSGRPLVIPWLIEAADAVIAAWFLGSEAGNAIADVLTGRVSPTGRTPMAWPRAVGQIPIFFGERPSGRPASAENHYSSKYIDAPNAPLFPFGHGLTYGHFVLSNLRATPGRLRESDTLEVRVDVRNDGRRAAEETVFLFSHDKVASVTRPLLELQGYGKIALESGASGTLTLRLPAAQLRFVGRELISVFEAGEVEIGVGPCADRAKLLITSVHLTT